MSSRGKTRLAWVLAMVAIVLMLSSVVMSAAAGASSSVFIWAIALVFSAVGLLIASRQSRNAIGWIFLMAGMGAGLGSVSHSTAQYWVDGHDVPAALGKASALYGELSWIPFILMPVTFLLLLFPDGRLLSSRWRAIAWCAALGIAGSFVADGLKPGKIPDFPQIMNPLGVSHPLRDLLEGLSAIAALIGIVGSSAGLIVRFRRSRGEQRQQMKWLALAGVVATVTFLVALALYDVIGEDAANAAIMLSVLGLPATTGVAILRYRLYDIDVVINRTLVYGALTATLAAIYIGSVLLLQLILSALTNDSGLAVAASTLAVAALFRPARARIQRVVDRRFYRRKYDAAQTLERFGGRLRDEVALDSLSAELRAVVADTMQPTHVSLWLRTPEVGR
jgi:MFS family permease